jgi:Mn-dependent DtxR family transcriptional regulator
MQNTAQPIQKRRSSRDSVERVDSYLSGREGRDFVAVTQIAEGLKLQVPSVRKCLEILQRFNRVEIASNGNIVLVKSKILNGVKNEICTN